MDLGIHACGHSCHQVVCQTLLEEALLMGISVAEYLAQKQACEVCDAAGNHGHCVENLLSRIDNCVFYNVFLYYFDDHTPNDIALLKELRSILGADTVLYYYVRAEPVVKRIIDRPNARDIWLVIHQRFVKDIFIDLRNLDRDAVTQKIVSMLDQLEKEF
jgi:hypothetical protein